MSDLWYYLPYGQLLANQRAAGYDELYKFTGSLNTYDYGFRGYYATIGRFTSIDPLAEQTPWQSPYAYAGNNIINNIDWMG